MIQNKGPDDEQIPVPPEEYQKDFISLQIYDKATITLFDMTRYRDMKEEEDDADEGGEDEIEDMEEGEDEDAEELIKQGQDIPEFENSPDKEVGFQKS